MPKADEYLEAVLPEVALLVGLRRANQMAGQPTGVMISSVGTGLSCGVARFPRSDLESTRDLVVPKLYCLSAVHTELRRPTLFMRTEASTLIGQSFPHKVNCFCISEFFFHHTELRNKTADEMLNFVATHFQQVDEALPNTMILIWSRSSHELPLGQIRIEDLAKRPPGFPFGLVLEHSFVQIENGMVFQKADPSLTSKVETIPLAKAIEPYAQLSGFEITRHIPMSQF